MKGSQPHSGPNTEGVFLMKYVKVKGPLTFLGYCSHTCYRQFHVYQLAIGSSLTLPASSPHFQVFSQSATYRIQNRGS